MNFIKEYEADVVGKSQGLDIPADYRILITMAYIRALADNTYELFMEVCTYTDNTYASQVINDDFPSNKAVVNVGGTLPTGSIKTVCKNEMNTILDASANVGTGNYTEDPV